MTKHSVAQSDYYYIRYSIAPPTQDGLTIRKVLAEAITQSFGMSAEGIYIDILWIKPSGEECAVRLNHGDAMTLLSASASFTGSVKFCVKHSSSSLIALGNLTTPLVGTQEEQID
ncbi:hypothetical protein CPB83DRAFT_284683 [Crepidotus variabilis]|uniref:Ribonucleases P/MRP subunit Pop8-like domain-containing protein n=1 Tax=Crepidotus variabilis TaxID=179855 RepID=A0A9P6EGG8_9AGAR|nr:hypothetical protein CPB83DRAFT_284683 [Crepidotus variabilis]